jgi:hypothetical protein
MGRLRWFGVALLAATLIAGCSDDESSSDSSSGTDDSGSEQAADAAPTKVKIVIGDTGITLEGTPKSGAVEVTVEGLAEGSEVDFTRVEEGTTVEETLDGLGTVTEGGAFPDFLLDNAGVNASGEAVMLDEGSYVVWTDLNTTGEGEGQLVGTELDVPAGDGAELPETDGEFVATDYSFAVDARAGDQFTFDNQSTEQFHHVIVFDFGDLDPAVVEENLPAFLASDESTPPPEALAGVDFENLEAGGSGVFGPGGSGTFAATLESGNTYAVACFIQDREGGAPHAMQHDMYDVFTVS